MTIDAFPSLKDLGRPDILAETIWSTKKGIILISGGPRSGITTTLASASHEIKRAGLNPVYLCDDESCAIPGIDSLTVNENKDALLAYLVGENRPSVLIFHETYNPAVTYLAFRAAEAGSLVIGGLHVNQNEDAIEEFMNSVPMECFISGRPNYLMRLSLFQELDTSSYSFITREKVDVNKSCSMAREYFRQEGFSRHPMDSGHRFNLNYHVKTLT